LGSPDFIASIKEKNLAGKKPDKEIPALKELHEKISIQQISALVDTVLGDEPPLSRNVKLYQQEIYGREIERYRRAFWYRRVRRFPSHQPNDQENG
jgi:hypothetical protein